MEPYPAIGWRWLPDSSGAGTPTPRPAPQRQCWLHAAPLVGISAAPCSLQDKERPPQPPSSSENPVRSSHGHISTPSPISAFREEAAAAPPYPVCVENTSWFCQRGAGAVQLPTEMLRDRCTTWENPTAGWDGAKPRRGSGARCQPFAQGWGHLHVPHSTDADRWGQTARSSRPESLSALRIGGSGSREVKRAARPQAPTLPRSSGAAKGRGGHTGIGADSAPLKLGTGTSALLDRHLRPQQPQGESQMLRASPQLQAGGETPPRPDIPCKPPQTQHTSQHRGTERRPPQPCAAHPPGPPLGGNGVIALGDIWWQVFFCFFFSSSYFPSFKKST